MPPGADRALRDLAVRYRSGRGWARTGSPLGVAARAGAAGAAGRLDRVRPPLIAVEPTWIGIVPVGYADGFRRDLTGTEVRVAGEPRRVIGTISMDALAVELDRKLLPGLR